MPLQDLNSKITPIAKEAADKALDKLAEGMRYIFGLSEGWQQRRDVLKNNYELGVMHYRLGNYIDATFRFKLVTWMDAKHGMAWYNLGRSYLAEGKKAKAIASLTKALQLMPGHEESQYMLTVIKGAKAVAQNAPVRVPPALCEEYFDIQAPFYDQQQLEEDKYEGHLRVEAALRQHMEEGRANHTMLELGVGTGLCGSRLRDVCKHIVGVDISQKMLELAGQLQNENGRNLYDELVHSDAEAYLEGQPEGSYDVVIASGLFSYLGQVQSVLQQVQRVLKKDGILIFTVDTCEGAEYRFLLEEGRFGYSEPYLRSLSATLHFGLLNIAKVHAYPTHKAWLCVWRK
jgi:predicted TPR repeat methyltransferase